MPKATSSAGREAVELAAQAGLELDGWQAQALEDALGERRDGRWAAFEVGIIVPRQNGKGAILEARELAGLFLFGEELILHSAHEFKTAAEAFRRILSLVQNTPELEKRVKRVRTSHGDEGIELTSGARLRFVARSTGSGRGFSGDTIILDEAYNLSPEAMAALIPTMSARQNPQLWYTSSAPLQTETSRVLRDFCRRGRAGKSPRLAYLEWCAASDAESTDRTAWAQANPALGIRIDSEFIENELAALGDEFARERLGLWNDDEQAGERVIDREAWAACADHASGIGNEGPFFFALDVTPDRQHGAIGVAGTSRKAGAEPLTHLEVVDHRTGTAWIVPRVRDLQAKWGGKVAISAGSPASSLVPDLESAGVEVELVNGTAHAQACGALFDAVAERRVRHLDQSELNAAIDGADRKFYGDSWLWSRKTSLVDISPLVAVTLAKWLHDQAPEPAMAAPGVILL